jgi:hypothetical protein
MRLSRKLASPRNVLIGAIALTLFVEKASAQTQPNLPPAVANDALTLPTSANISANISQWANVGLANGIHAQMRAGSDVVLRSELFTSIAFVALLIAMAMLMFRIIQWVIKSTEARVAIPVNLVELFTPLILVVLLINPVDIGGSGFAMQSIVVGTGDLLNSFQSYILTNGSKATLAGGSAVREAGAKAQIEQSIRQVQITCSATLNQEERKTCYNDGHESVQASLDSFRSAQWAKDLSAYSSEVLLQNGKNSDQLTNIGGAIGGVLGGAIKTTTDNATNFGSGLISPSIYATLLLVSSAFGVVIGILQMLMAMFFPLSIALSLAPIFDGSWVKWFTGMFQIWLSGLFLRMLTTILAIITVSGSSVSGGLYVVAATMIAAICGVIAIASVISTTTGVAGNVTNNVANLR